MESDALPWMIAAGTLGVAAAGMAYAGYRSTFCFAAPKSASTSAPRRAAEGEEDAEVILCQGESTVVGPSGSLSPYCLKIEAFLRLAGIPYRSKDVSPLDAPKGKIPYIVHGSSTVCDSRDIIRYILNTHTHEDKAGRACGASTRAGDRAGFLGDLLLPGAIPAARLGAAKAVEAILEQRVYYTSMMRRWISDEGFRRVVAAFFGSLPAPLRLFVPALVRKQVWLSLMSHGIAAHSEEDIRSREEEDWDTVAAVLGDGPFLGGDAPCAQDCTLFATLDGLLNGPFATPGKEYVMARHPGLVAYADAFRARVFPDAGPVAREVRDRSTFILKP